MSAAVAYIRASKDEQKLTLEGQREQIAAWAAREGVTIVSWHEDPGVCSVTPLDERAGFMDAVASLKTNGAGRLIVAKWDRIARSVFIAATAEHLAEKMGARIEACDGIGASDGPEGEMLRGIMYVFAQYERALIRARTKAALAIKAKRGEFVGKPPYGWKLGADGKHLEQDEREQAVIGIVRSLRDVMSQREIVRELEGRGIVSRAGKPLERTQVARILARAA